MRAGARATKDTSTGVLGSILKYGPQKEFVINRIDRQSSPGRRLYKKVADLEPVMDGIGIAVLSTPQGILSDRQCRERNVGGEILFTVW